MPRLQAHPVIRETGHLPAVIRRVARTQHDPTPNLEQQMTDQLPHDPYITAVTEALTAAGLPPADQFTDDCDTSGSHRYLRAVITLHPDEEHWPHGLVLIWEWHTGIEAGFGEPERGPSWALAVLADRHGQIRERQAFTVLGYPTPRYVVESVRALAARRNQNMPAERWDQAHALDAACEAWGAAEART